MVNWVPVAKALRRYGPIVGPFLLNKARDEAQPYWQAYRQARSVDGSIGVWQDEAGKHWVVLSPDLRTIVGAYPPMSRAQRELALDNLDAEGLQHHTETVLHKLGRAPAQARDRAGDLAGRARDRFSR